MKLWVKIKQFIKNYTHLKYIKVSLGIALICFYPCLKIIYWSFESAFLGEFGISQEIYSRPLFSSTYQIAWLSVYAIWPATFLWLIISLVIPLVIIFFRYPNFKQKEDLKLLSKEEYIKSRMLGKITDISNYFFETAIIPFLVFTLGALLFIGVGHIFGYAQKKGSALAHELLDAYVSQGICLDKITSSQFNCYTITGVDENVYLIDNSDTHLVFLRKSETEEKAVELRIIEKEKDKSYEIIRSYKSDP
ncbi:MAG: hypothetical protein CMD81_05950 [Gammaproteobacteria bacterium]|nr:hypothetical protein [Gammaproteobacteria bacterium]HBF08279.1 hypothetical protein [Gammaproteobacteria bacterium]